MKRIGSWLLAYAAFAVLATGAPETRAQDAEKFDRLLGVVEPVKGKRPYRIGYASADMNAAFFLGIAYGLVDEAKHAGVDIVRIVSAGGYGNVAEQVGQLESLGAMDLDAVILLASAYDGFDRPIQRLVEKGVKVVLLGAPVNSEAAALVVSQDEPAIGRSLAEHICKRKPDAKVVTLPGPPGVAWNKLRFDGFTAAAAKCPGMELVGNVFKGNIALEEGQSQATDLLLKHPDADYVYAVAGVLAVGAAQAIKRMNHKARVVTGTLAKRTADLIREGYIEMAVSEPSILFGRATLQYTVRLLNGDPMPNLIPGIFPYPAAFVRNLEISADTLKTYNLFWYDLPPDGWKPAQLQ